MYYLIFTILVSCVISVVYKYASVKEINSDHITLVNYIVAAASAAGTVVAEGKLHLLAEVFKADIPNLFRETTAGNSAFYALFGGILMGVVYLAGFMVMKNSIRENGTGITVFFQKTGYVFVIILSALIWKEYPSCIQWAGIGLTAVALFIFIGNFKKLRIQRPSYLFFLIFIGIMTELNTKVFTMCCWQDYKPILLMVIYGTACLMCFLLIFGKHKRAKQTPGLTIKEVLCGILVGVANCVSVSMQITCLSKFPAAIVFPVLAAGNLILTFLIGIAAFHEPFNKKQLAGLLTASFGLILINL